MLNHEDPVTRAFATHRAELKAIQSVIHDMPDVLRIPIHLCSEGYKYQEIASIMASKGAIHTLTIQLAAEFGANNNLKNSKPN